MKSTYLLPLLTFVILLFSCKSDDDMSPDGDLQITRVSLTITKTSGIGVPAIYSYTIDNGTPAVDAIMLDANSTYNFGIAMWNEQQTPAEDVTMEILSEADEYLICFDTSGINTTYSVTDTDSNGLPLGLASSWSTGAASSGELEINLRHQSGLKANPVDCSVGESRIKVIFPLTIQ